MDIRLYILLVFGIVAIYSFIIIYIESQKSIRQSDRVKRESILIYSGNNKSKLFTYKYKEVIITAQPQYIYENKAGELILINNEEDFRNRDIPDYYRYKIGAEFLAVESEYKRAPIYAVVESLKTGKHIIIENNLELRNETLDIIKEMADTINEGKAVERNHEESARCQNCFYRVDCPVRIK